MASRIVFVGPERDPKFVVDDCMIPDIHDGQILAQISMATVCGSDVHTLEGRRKEAYPSVLGHEAVAKVIESKRNDLDLKAGDRITFSVIDSCGECERCRNLVPQKCIHLKKYGHRELSDGSGFTGCYATHIILDPGTAIFKIPDNIPDHVAAPINCALATMINAVSSIPSNDRRYSTALIQGAGLLGVYGCALLKERGFKKVFCSDINRDRVCFVHNFGGIPIHEGLPQFEDHPKENSIDLVIEVCGVPSVVQTGLRLLRHGGMYIFVGMVHPDSHLNVTAELLVRKCLTLKGVHNYAPCHLEESVKFIALTHNKYPYESLLSVPVDLRDFHAVLKMVRSQKYHRVAIKP